MKNTASPKLTPAEDASAGTQVSKVAKTSEQTSTVKPATASREDNLMYDLKHMAAFDFSVLHGKLDFVPYTRDTVQLLVNRLFALPRQELDVGNTVELPSNEVFRLPRQKPVPKVKAKTRWQKFMEDRNMNKRKRSRLVWDEISKDWKPRWGYKSIKHSQDNAQWMHEVKDGDDPMTNPFETQDAKRKLILARQKMREVRNKVEGAGGKLKVSAPDLENSLNRGKEGLKEAVKRSQISSASFGKFDRKAPNEITNLQKPKRVSGPCNIESEKEKNMKFATRILAGETVDKEKAAKLGAAQSDGKKQGIGRKPEKYKRRSKQGGRKR